MTQGGPRVAVVGAGWSGATCARLLSDAGVRVEVFEELAAVGGHSRVETMGGVVYEPNGPHIFHTSDPEVHAFVVRFGMQRPFVHRVLTEIHLDDDNDRPVLLSWPLQLHELQVLPIWPQVERELSELPARPHGSDFETFAISALGPTLYRLFVEDYTRKQWGTDPSLLSAEFAPKRVPLRRDGDTRMFRDRWEYFPTEGVNAVIEAVLAPAAVTLGARIGMSDLDALAAGCDAVVITAPLDEFVGRGARLDWRGVRTEARLVPTDELDGVVTAAYVVNRPSARVPHTRTVESKHATGQRVGATVVCEEHPGAVARHYPVLTVDHRNRRAHDALVAEIREASPVPVFFVGRLAEYVYIDQDEAIRRATDRSDEILRLLHE